jgi:hypothetical protein
MRRNFPFSSVRLANHALTLLAALSLLPSMVAARPPQRLSAQTFRFAKVGANARGCEVYYSLQPVDPNLLKLLGTPAVPTNSSLLTSPEDIQQRDWDFPSKVTPWSQRPKPEEISRRREELAALRPPKPRNPKALRFRTGRSGITVWSHSPNTTGTICKSGSPRSSQRSYPALASIRKKPITPWLSA